MKPPFSYVCIDLETGGLSDDCSIIEFAAVVDIPGTPLADLPRFSYLVGNTELKFEAYAFNMHLDRYEELDRANTLATKGLMDSYQTGTRWYGKCPSYMLARHFREFLRLCGWDCKSKITPAGKNFAGFDRRFLDKLLDSDGKSFTQTVPFSHRALDPGPMHFHYETGHIPSLEEITGNVVAHTALADALDTVVGIRRGLGIDV